MCKYALPSIFHVLALEQFFSEWSSMILFPSGWTARFPQKPFPIQFYVNCGDL
jgi:hypothetical protein